MFSRFRAVLIIWLGLGIFFWGTHVPHVLAGKPEDETDNDEPVDSIENSRPEGFFQAKKANDRSLHGTQQSDFEESLSECSPVHWMSPFAPLVFVAPFSRSLLKVVRFRVGLVRQAILRGVRIPGPCV